MHRTNLKGVNFNSSASKTCKLCVIGSPVAISNELWKALAQSMMTEWVHLSLFHSPASLTVPQWIPAVWSHVISFDGIPIVWDTVYCSSGWSMTELVSVYFRILQGTLVSDTALLFAGSYFIVFALFEDGSDVGISSVWWYCAWAD